MSYYWDGSGSDWGGSATTDTGPLTSHPATMVAWAKVDSAATNKSILIGRNSASNLNYEQLLTLAAGTVMAQSRNNTVNYTSTTTDTVGTGWVMLHMTCGGTTTTSADRTSGINGTEATPQTTDLTWDATPNQFIVGDRPGATQMFKGYIAGAAVYNKVLSGAELTALVTTWFPDASSYADCIAYYDFRSDIGGDTVVNTKNPGTYNLTLVAGGGTKPVYNSDNPVLTIPYLKLLPHRRENTLLRM